MRTIVRALIVMACAGVTGAIGHAQRPAVDAAACERLATSLKLRDATVTSATAVPAGQFVPPGGRGAAAAAGLPAFCRVQLTLKPSADSDIKSEVWLPLSGWNDKFQQVGNGAWGGSIQYDALGAALRLGYAVASTDTGHTGTDASFAIGHPEKLIDFGYRSVHETAVQAKAAATALYQAAPRLSYFSGCSGGGRQAFMEAQRYPADFDGIVAGAPGYDRTNQSLQLVAIAQATLNDPASAIPTSKFAVLHQAALVACDRADGLEDGLISDPLRCRFDPAVTLCAGSDGPGCLTASQVEAARKIYAPLKDSQGRELFPGQEPGSETRWPSTVGGPRPLAVADDLFKALFQDPNWNFRSLNYGADADRALKFDGGTLTASSVELKPFVSRGGRMVMYHGWADQNISPRSSVNYYTRLVQALGQSQVDQAIRLYMVPGMEHCGGGAGPNVFDMLIVLDNWRDRGKAPDSVIASHVTSGKVDRTRPLCPYPQMARYNGAGSVDRAENFVCR